MVTANTHTHSLTYTDTRLHMHPLAHPPTHTHTHTQDLGKRRGKGGFDRHTFYKTRDYNNNRK